MCARGGRKIRRAAMKSLVSKKGEREGLFSLCGDSEIRGRQYFGLRERRGKLGEDKRVAGAASGHDEFVDLVFGKNKAVEGVHD